jgi:hypothetical protein
MIQTHKAEQGAITRPSQRNPAKVPERKEIDPQQPKPNQSALILEWLAGNPGWHLSRVIATKCGSQAKPALIRAHLTNLSKAHRVLRRVKHESYAKGTFKGIGGYTGPVYEYRRVVNMDV